jgi:SLT domain-containing protein
MLTGAGFASGGQMNMRRWNLVGEHGPELVAPGGFVVPMGGRHGFNAHSGGGGTHIVINHHGDVNGVQQHEEMMADWSNQIMRRLSVSTTMTGVPALGY